MKNSTALQSLFSEFLSPTEIQLNEYLALISSSIISWRIGHHMTQSDLGEIMGVKQAMVSKWESGEYNFTIRTLTDISVKLGISIQELLFGKIEYTSEPASVPFSADIKPSANSQDTNAKMQFTAGIKRPFEFSIVSGGDAA